MSSNYDQKRVGSRLQDLEETSLSKQNVQDLKAFARDYELENYAPATPLAVIDAFKRIADLVEFDLRDAEKEQVEDLVLKINREEHGDYAARTLADDRAAIQTFYSWYLDTKSPEICDFIRCKARPSELPKLDPEELLNVEEAEKIIDACMNPRDRAMLGLLWDSGMRTKEIMELEWRDIKVDQDGMLHLHIRNGKNGPRRIYLYESVPLVTAWLDNYPDPQPEDPLWIDLRWPSKKQKVGQRALYKQIKEARKRTEGIPDRRRSNPHAWRKARATFMAAQGMNLPAANKFFGWARGSTVFKKYIWLAETDLENTMREIYGLDPKKKEQKFIGENLKEYQGKAKVEREPMLLAGT